MTGTRATAAFKVVVGKDEMNISHSFIELGWSLPIEVLLLIRDQ